MTPVTTHLLYLHGFRSSPRSAKARIASAWIAAHRPEVVLHVPQLPPSPAEAIAGLERATAGWPDATTGVIGSSLGGYYATVLAERRGWRAALLNPAVEPARDLRRHLGETTLWHSDERFFFRPEFIGELEAMRPAAPTRPERYLAVVARGDEVLDWRETVARYPGVALDLIEGLDHALSDFDTRVAHVMAFFGLAPGARS